MFHLGLTKYKQINKSHVTVRIDLFTTNSMLFNDSVFVCRVQEHSSVDDECPLAEIASLNKKQSSRLRV